MFKLTNRLANPVFARALASRAGRRVGSVSPSFTAAAAAYAPSAV